MQTCPCSAASWIGVPPRLSLSNADPPWSRIHSRVSTCMEQGGRVIEREREGGRERVIERGEGGVHSLMKSILILGNNKGGSPAHWQLQNELELLRPLLAGEQMNLYRRTYKVHTYIHCAQ